jgi:hypothetical protein
MSTTGPSPGNMLLIFLIFPVFLCVFLLDLLIFL